MGIYGHYDFDDHDATKPQPANYPSGPLAPVADRIVYDPLSMMNDSAEEPSQLTLSQNPNLALSDLLDLALFQPEVKKRKRPGHDDEGEEEEFFTSKRQKKQAMTKKHSAEADEVADAPRPGKRLPRRSAVQPGIYTDLGEDAVPIEEDEEGLIPAYSQAPSNRKRKVVNPKDDLELAAKAMSNLAKPNAKRGRPKGTARERVSNTITDWPTPKRRGRPPKKAVALVGLRSPSPAYKPAAPKMLSLKEKLALTGKSFKIVSKPQQSTEVPFGPSSARSTPSTMPGYAMMPKSILKRPSIVIPVASDGGPMIGRA
ncbi:hypothetical protein IFR05_016860 [Cadophora sp. M221]|nr:hypothetical protein IFR05_016860 [Cadophora sp. M221]